MVSLNDRLHKLDLGSSPLAPPGAFQLQAMPSDLRHVGETSRIQTLLAQRHALFVSFHAVLTVQFSVAFCTTS